MTTKRIAGIALALLYTLMIGLVALATETTQARVAAPRTIPDISLAPIDVVPAFDPITDIASAGDDRLFVVEKAGRIKVLHPNGTVSPFLDITSRVGSFGYQMGLLGLVFHPDYADNGYFYVHYTDPTNVVHVARFGVGANPNQADPGSELTLMTVDLPEFAQENYGGDLSFGADGMLYIALGDGGINAYPPYENNNGRDLTVLPGKILRVDVDGGAPYAIPADNPLVGDPTARGEIWAYGLRNPWRFSFDALTGDLWLGDVGQYDWEEIDMVPAGSGGGQDFGWPCYEGSAVHANPPTGTCVPLPASEPPVHEYSHLINGSYSCAVIGGYRYRGASYPALVGHYLYADSCSGTIWSLSPDGSGGWAETTLLHPAAFAPTTFGVDQAGDLLLASNYAGQGHIYRIVENTPPPTPEPTDFTVFLPQLMRSP